MAYVFNVPNLNLLNDFLANNNGAELSIGVLLGFEHFDLRTSRILQAVIILREGPHDFIACTFKLDKNTGLITTIYEDGYPAISNSDKEFFHILLSNYVKRV